MEKNKRIKIGIDIDDVLIHSLESFLYFFNKKYNTDIKKTECVSNKRFHECLNISKEKLLLLYSEYEKLEMPMEVRKIEGAEKALNKIKTECDFILITARPKKIKKKTYEILNKHYPEHNFKVFFTKDNLEKKGKGEICIREGVSLMIDDDWKNALDCAKKEIKVFLLDNPWNRGVVHENIIRVYSWDEILEKINTLNNLKIK
jgi:uncharacterized protein